MIPEFMGRLPVIVSCDALDVDALTEVLWKPKNALAKQYHRLFELEGVKLNFRPDALRAIAEEAARRNSGARGLRAILEEVMLDVMYEIPSLTGVKECVVTREVVEHRARPELVLESKAASYVSHGSAPARTQPNSVAAGRVLVDAGEAHLVGACSRRSVIVGAGRVDVACTSSGSACAGRERPSAPSGSSSARRTGSRCRAAS